MKQQERYSTEAVWTKNRYIICGRSWHDNERRPNKRSVILLSVILLRLQQIAMMWNLHWWESRSTRVVGECRV
jgi:hypothetical protein